MSSYDKVVKLACKPKAAPPKAKYLDTIIAATWSEDGAVHDVCKALAPRFREPNVVVVFKALIVLHTMMRNGATDNVLSYLSSSEVLRLRNVTAGNWDGYAAPQNLQHYALYLDSRIRAYRDLKHDAIRVQAESNRDMRNSNNIEEDNAYRGRSNGRSNGSMTPSRSKTIMGRKLRVMTVEKGLLRETKAVHNMIDTLVECRFYLDDLEDELTTTALRMLVKDLLILFQAGNEGVINVLEHYFEMSHVDAEEALSIYRHFCKQTEKVVEYLGVGKKLQNLLNVPIPNLKHAPVSLAGALEEYLNDPNFEQNRIEYKTNKEASERAARNGTKKPAQKETSPAPPLPTSPSSSAPATSSTSTSNAGNAPQPQNVIDFFSTIEEEQPTMFNPQTNSPSTAYFQQQQASNPFALRQMQMATGQTFGIQPQATGFLSPQQSAFQQGPNPFGLQPQPQQRLHVQPTGHRPFSSFIPQNNGLSPQQTGFLQSQATGSNPFRQSILMPQTTGMALFGVGGGSNLGMQGSQSQSHPQQQHTGAFQNMGMGGLGQSQGVSAWDNSNNQQQQQFQAPAMLSSTSAFSPAPSTGTPFSQLNMPARPASTPLTSMATSARSSSPPVAQPVKAHQTGTRNPFGPISQPPPPPLPKQPTLMELAMDMNNVNLGAQQQQQQQPSSSIGANGFSFSSGALSPGATDMSGIASSFAFTRTNTSNAPPSSSFTPLNSQNTSTTTSGSTFSDSLFSSSLSSQPTGATNLSSAPTGSLSSPLKSQLTGFGGVKPFKPSSSFGASLLETLPPVPGSAPTTPAITGAHLSPTLTQSGGSTGLGALGSPQTGLALGPTSGLTTGQGLRPQLTGNPAANPFRATMFSTTGGGSGGMNSGMGGPSTSAFSSQPTGLNSGGLGGTGMFGGGAGFSGTSLGMGGNSSFGSFNPQQQQQQQQQNASSLM
ncbi:ANTH-domain-containing protein [Marasmius fiardii PR-910]|nr:ANTH-domain-containing protein [Marasmius fiardii PR-910]